MKPAGRQNRNVGKRPAGKPAANPDAARAKARKSPFERLAASAQEKFSFCAKHFGHEGEFIDFLGALRGVAMTAAPSHKADPHGWKTFFNYLMEDYSGKFGRINRKLAEVHGKKPGQITEQELEALFLSMMKKYSAAGLTAEMLDEEFREKARQGKWTKAYFG